MTRHPFPALLAWLAAALFALGAWLALPRERVASGAPVHALLVDVSDSAIGARYDSQIDDWIERRRTAVVAGGSEVRTIAFGQGARHFDFSKERGGSWFGAGEDRSDLAAALELADVLAQGRLRSIEILGDGTWTGADPAGVAARLAARGVRIELVENLRDGFDAYVAPLASPIRVREGEPVVVQLETWRAMGMAGFHNDLSVLVVAATLTEGAVTTRREARIPVSRSEHGPHPVRVDLEFPPLTTAQASIVADVRLEGARGGRVGHTDASRCVTRAQVIAEGVLSIGVVGEPAARRAFVDSLAPANADFAFVELDDARAASIAGLDVFVTLDAQFDRDSAPAVDAFVTAGGGWIDFAGARCAVGERPRSAPLAPARDDERPREIVVLVDASGSMAGAPAQAARAALVRLVERAPLADGLSTVWFGADARAIDLGRPGQRADVEQRREFSRSAWNAPEPRGPTRIWRALDEFASDVDASRRTLAILVSDGRDPDRAEIAARAKALRTRLEGVGAELAVVAVGSDPDLELLAVLAGGAARIVRAGELGAEASIDALARSLETALATGSIVEIPDPRAATRSGAGPFSKPFAALEPPALRRHVRARAADGAEVVWTSAAPVLAFARRGLGVAAGFAFGPDASWVAVPNDLGGAVASALRAVAPPTDRARTRLGERGGELVLEGVPDGAPAIVRADLVSSRGEPLGSVDLLAARAGRDPVRERSAPLPAALASLAAGDFVRARIAPLVAGGTALDLAFAAPRAPEFARAPRRFEPPAPRQGASEPHGSGSHPSAPWVLLAGLVSLAGAAGAGVFSRSRGRAA
ncbi:MAG: VWA domain-containing protein [Planctomycetota bacterium]|nr:VWA domain-containing protein [Planctomycetota bacterium]